MLLANLLAHQGQLPCCTNILNVQVLSDLTLSKYFFIPLVMYKSQNKHGLRAGEYSLSYSRCLILFKNALGQIGVDSSKFGLHSLLNQEARQLQRQLEYQTDNLEGIASGNHNHLRIGM